MTGPTTSASGVIAVPRVSIRGSAPTAPLIAITIRLYRPMTVASAARLPHSRDRPLGSRPRMSFEAFAAEVWPK